MNQIPALPDSLRRLVDPDKMTIKTLGRSGALVLSSRDRFLKIDKAGSLSRAAAMHDYFARKGLSSPLLAFEQSDEHDFMLTAAMKGRDATEWLQSGETLSARMGEAIRALHETDAADCPFADANSRAIEAYLSESGKPLPGNIARLKADRLIHGDCCLPNIFFDESHCTGFIDVGDGGLGDVHFDLYWACWSLGYNFKTPRYTARFLDAYGRDAIDEERFDLCSCLSRSSES